MRSPSRSTTAALMRRMGLAAQHQQLRARGGAVGRLVEPAILADQDLIGNRRSARPDGGARPGALSFRRAPRRDRRRWRLRLRMARLISSSSTAEASLTKATPPRVSMRGARGACRSQNQRRNRNAARQVRIVSSCHCYKRRKRQNGRGRRGAVFAKARYGMRRANLGISRQLPTGGARTAHLAGFAIPPWRRAG